MLFRSTGCRPTTRAPRGLRPTERKHVRSFVPLSLRRPSVRLPNQRRARASHGASNHPTTTTSSTRHPPSAVRAVDRRTPRRVSRACTVYAFSTSKDSKKLIKFHFFFQTDDDANRRTRRRSPIDVLLFPRRACRPDDDGWMDAKCPPRPDPKKKTGFGIFNLWRVVNRRKVHG